MSDTPNTPTPPNTPDTPPSPAAPPPPAPDQGWKPPKRALATGVFALCIAAGVLIALAAWDLPPFRGSVVSTNNAYVRGQTTLISPRVGGYVTEVLVSDFAQVKQGDVLLRIDDAPYAARVAQAEANLAGQQAQLGKVDQGRASANANIRARQTAIRNAEAQLKLAQTTFDRLNQVKNSEGIAAREYEQALSALEQARAGHAAALAQYTVAQQDALSVNTGQESATAAISGAEATLELARQELAHTVVRAPADGRLGEVSVKTGQLVSAGSQLMFIVPPRHWVVANFKEADTAHIRPGQRARVKVDALGGQAFEGTVTQLAPATTAEFSVIRADSGSGNFVKIPQRVAVKIELDESQPDADRLMPGLSVEAFVDTATLKGQP